MAIFDARSARPPTLRKVADSGELAALLDLGLDLLDGTPTVGDKRLAKRYLSKAGIELKARAANGDVVATAMLGKMSLYGWGTKKDNRTALAMFRIAADSGESTYQFELGWRLFLGEDFKRNSKAALKLIESAANKGHLEACYFLASRYATGEDGLPKKADEAVRLYRRAAERNHVPSQWNLSCMLERGEAGPPNQTASLWWLMRAAAGGAPEAIEKLKAQMRSRRRAPSRVQT